MGRFKDELSKAKAAVDALATRQIELAGYAGGKSKWEEQIWASEGLVNSVSPDSIKASQIFDLVHSNNPYIYCGRLQIIYRYLLRGADIDKLIEILFQDVRESDEETQEAIKETINALLLANMLPSW
jgi:hypothetical protein